jgi:hypothetical protein
MIVYLLYEKSSVGFCLGVRGLQRRCGRLSPMRERCFALGVVLRLPNSFRPLMDLDGARFEA